MDNAQLPSNRTPWKRLEEELLEKKRGDVDRRHALFGFAWPTPPGQIGLVAKEAANLFFNYCAQGGYTQPSVAGIEAEVRQMALEILRGPEGSACTLTTDGTESNFHAVKTVRDWARDHRPGRATPEIVVPYTAHPSFNKAAAYMDLKVVRVPQGDDLRADVPAMSDAINDNTIMIVGSAPTWPHGKVDPIPDLAALALDRGVWCHVDACIGGFLIPFLRELGQDLPAFDFTVPGVASISADLHKFGYAPIGVSTFSLRDGENLKYQRFSFSDWPYGTHATDTFTGTRSAMASVAAWAVMKHLGVEGYLDIARGIQRATRMVVDGLEAIDGLDLVTEPEAGVVVCTATAFDIFAVSEAMAERGFMTYRCKSPPSMHLLMDPVEDETAVGAYLHALAAAVADAKAGTAARKDDEVTYA